MHRALHIAALFVAALSILLIFVAQKDQQPKGLIMLGKDNVSFSPYLPLSSLSPLLLLSPLSPPSFLSPPVSNLKLFLSPSFCSSLFHSIHLLLIFVFLLLFFFLLPTISLTESRNCSFCVGDHNCRPPVCQCIPTIAHTISLHLCTAQTTCI